MPKSLFITGTDTDVGKTVVTTALIAFLNRMGYPTNGVKPICCGGLDDVEAIEAVNASLVERSILNPLYLDEPAAPASIGAPNMAIRDVLSRWDKIDGEFMVVEGAGGWCVPVTETWDMEDLAVEVDAPVIMVVANRLGALNHAQLTARAIQSKGLTLMGYVLNTVSETEYTLAQETNRTVLDELLPCPCLAEVPLGGGYVSANILCEALKIPHRSDLPLHFSVSDS